MFSTRMLPWTATACLFLLLADSLHAETGPHGGAIFCGPKHKHHAELVLKADEGHATVYILDGKAKKPVLIKAKTIELHIKGMEQPIVLTTTEKDSEPSATFSGKHEKLMGKLDLDHVTFKIKIDDGPAQVFEMHDH